MALQVFGRAADNAGHAASLLSREYTLVATNVPTRAWGASEALRSYGNDTCPAASGDLATMFLARISDWFSRAGQQLRYRLRAG